MFIWKLIYLALVLILGWLLTTKFMPWAIVRVGRLLGFRMRPTPITARRLMRFRSIKRGYFSFLGISTLFVISLFLELIVNEKPLMVSYNGKIATPALWDWVSKPLFMFNISSFEKRSDFGQAGNSEVDYHLYMKTIEDPSIFDAELNKAKAKMDKAETRFKKLSEPGADASERAKEKFATRKAMLASSTEQFEKLAGAKELFANGGAWIIPTLYPWSPHSHRHDIVNPHPRGRASRASASWVRRRVDATCSSCSCMASGSRLRLRSS